VKHNMVVDHKTSGDSSCFLKWKMICHISKQISWLFLL